MGWNGAIHGTGPRAMSQHRPAVHPALLAGEGLPAFEAITPDQVDTAHARAAGAAGGRARRPGGDLEQRLATTERPPDLGRR